MDEKDTNQQRNLPKTVSCPPAAYQDGSRINKTMLLRVLGCNITSSTGTTHQILFLHTCILLRTTYVSTQAILLKSWSFNNSCRVEVWIVTLANYLTYPSFSTSSIRTVPTLSSVRRPTSVRFVSSIIPLPESILFAVAFCVTIASNRTEDITHLCLVTKSNL